MPGLISEVTPSPGEVRGAWPATLGKAAGIGLRRGRTMQTRSLPPSYARGLLGPRGRLPKTPLAKALPPPGSPRRFEPAPARERAGSRARRLRAQLRRPRPSPAAAGQRRQPAAAARFPGARSPDQPLSANRGWCASLLRPRKGRGKLSFGERSIRVFALVRMEPVIGPRTTPASELNRGRFSQRECHRHHVKQSECRGTIGVLGGCFARRCW